MPVSVLKPLRYGFGLELLTHYSNGGEYVEDSKANQLLIFIPFNDCISCKGKTDLTI